MQVRRPLSMSGKIGPSFNAVELAGSTAIRQLQEEKLRRQIDYLNARSIFYRSRFAADGIRPEHIRSVDDLKRIPFTTKQELRDSLERMRPLGEHLAAPLSEIVQIQASSGTTGRPSYVGLTENDVISWKEMTARCLFACGMRPGDLVLHGYSMSKGFVGGIPMFQAVQYLGAIDIPIGADGGAERLLIACRDLRPRCIIGTPYFLLHLADMTKDVIGMEASALGVECLIVGGEPGGGIPAVREALESRWNARCCELMGGTDLGCSYWAESDDQVGMYLVAADEIIVELIDPATGAVLDWREGAAGELVYTAIGREASPLLRFRSGDHVNVTAMGGLGRHTPAIRCFGRTDDMLIVRGVNLFPSALVDLVAGMEGTSGTVRVVADFPSHTTQNNLKVIVERHENRPPERDRELKQMLEEKIRNTLGIKALVCLAPAGFFKGPGASKVSLTLTEVPEGLHFP